MKLRPGQLRDIVGTLQRTYEKEQLYPPAFDMMAKQVLAYFEDAMEYEKASDEDRKLADSIEMDYPIRQIRMKDLPDYLPAGGVDHLAPVIADYTEDVPQKRKTLREQIEELKKKETE